MGGKDQHGTAHREGDTRKQFAVTVNGAFHCTRAGVVL